MTFERRCACRLEWMKKMGKSENAREACSGQRSAMRTRLVLFVTVYLLALLLAQNLAE